MCRQYALLVGSTWQTNSLVFGVILATILAANILVLTRLKRVPIGAMYAFLVPSLVLSYFLPIARLNLAPGIGSYAAAGAYLGVPILLAAVMFATTFRKALVGSTALASNLLGAVLRGALEYLSLAWGIRSLSLIAAGMYLAAAGFWLASRLRPAAVEPAQEDVPEPAFAGGR